MTTIVKKKKRRYSISVSSKTYDRLRSTVSSNLARFVDTIVLSAIDDPTTSKRLVAQCRASQTPET